MLLVFGSNELPACDHNELNGIACPNAVFYNVKHKIYDPFVVKATHAEVDNTILRQIIDDDVLLDFSLSVKAAPHECAIRTGLLYAVKAEKKAWFYSKVTVSSCATTSVII